MEIVCNPQLYSVASINKWKQNLSSLAFIGGCSFIDFTDLAVITFYDLSDLVKSCFAHLHYKLLFSYVARP